MLYDIVPPPIKFRPDSEFFFFSSSFNRSSIDPCNFDVLCEVHISRVVRSFFFQLSFKSETSMGVSPSKTSPIFDDPMFVLHDVSIKTNYKSVLERQYLHELPPDLQRRIASELDDTSSHNYSLSSKYIHDSLEMHLHSLKKAFENNIEMRFRIGEDNSIGFRCTAILDETERDSMEERCEILHMQLEAELELKPKDRFTIFYNKRYYDELGYQTVMFTSIHFRDEKKSVMFNETKFKKYVNIMYTFIKQNIKKYHSVFTSTKYYITSALQTPSTYIEKEVIFRIARYDHFDDKKSEDTRFIFEKSHYKVDHEFMVVDEDRFDEDELYLDMTY